MAAVSSLSEVNTKIEAQRSIMMDKALEFRDLAKQLQAKGANTFGGCDRVLMPMAIGSMKFSLIFYTFRTSPECTGERGKLFNGIFGNE